MEQKNRGKMAQGGKEREGGRKGIGKGYGFGKKEQNGTWNERKQIREGITEERTRMENGKEEGGIVVGGNGGKGESGREEERMGQQDLIE